MKKRVAILQSNYIPWKGYFDIIGNVDLFIFHDDIQYTKGDWRNRNKIKTEKGFSWLTVPCGTSEKRLICDVNLPDPGWQDIHWRKIVSAYSKAPFFNMYRAFFEDIYKTKWVSLSEMNQEIIKRISYNILKIETVFDDSRAYNLTQSKGERVKELLMKCNADTYLSGPSAKNYLNIDDFSNDSIEIEFMDYSGYIEYPQLYPPFIHEVSIIDLIFNVGDDIGAYMLCCTNGT